MYTEYYALAERPFQLTPDARFWFESRTHKKAMAYLGYGLAQGEGFIVITGDVGAGKSTLVAHLMATIDRARLNAINIVSTQVEGTDMLRLAAQGLGIDTSRVEKAQLLERVEAVLEDNARAGKRTLLIVDEAQNLPVSALEELRMLSNYQVGGRALLQIFLLGQPEFREELSKSESLEQLRQRVIATHHLEPMGESEVGPYIGHRLALAGADGRPAFDEGAYAAIYRETGGVPRRVNQLASRVLLYGAVEQLDTIDADTVAAVVADISEDMRAPAPKEERVLPLRSYSPAASEAPQQSSEPVRDLALERRVAALEAKLEEQETALRRVLTLLVDWVENNEPVSYRHNAA
jgi:putative secretion ATPase (PEP-CTERM system associated)